MTKSNIITNATFYSAIKENDYYPKSQILTSQHKQNNTNKHKQNTTQTNTYNENTDQTTTTNEKTTPENKPQENNHDYITDVLYTSHVYTDLSPINLISSCAFSMNSNPDISSSFNYCELGCGLGESTVAFASVYPHGNFFGIDFNKDHIDIAKNYENILTNLKYIQASFATACEMDIPQFDFIVMHGVWSWVNSDVQNDICKFVAKFLKRNGIFYLSYNCMAGWCDFLPIRELMLEFSSVQTGTLIEKAHKSLEYLNHLKSTSYLKNVSEMIEYLLTLDLRYIVHEFFNGTWKPEYFGHLVKKLSKIGLSYATSSPLMNNGNFLIESSEVKDLLSTASDNVTFETHKSLIIKQRFRKDIFKKQNCELLNQQSLYRFLKDLYFINLKVPDQLKLAIGAQEITLTGEIYTLIIDCFHKKACRITDVFIALNNITDDNLNIIKEKNIDIENLTDYTYTISDICDCILQLIMFNVITPAIMPQTLDQYSLDKHLSLTNNFNIFKLDNLEYTKNNVQLSSNILGNVFDISIIDAIFLKIILNHTVDKNTIIQITFDEINNNNLYKFWPELSSNEKNSKEVPDEEKTYTFINFQLNAFFESLLPNLYKLNIIKNTKVC